MTTIKLTNGEVVSADADPKVIYQETESQGFFMEALGDQFIVIPKHAILYMIG